jgi:hypothetical protein
MPMPSWLLRICRCSRLPRVTQLPFGVEITMLLVIKICLLMVLARLCFAEPQVEHMHMPATVAGQHSLIPAATALCAPSGNCTGLPVSPKHVPNIAVTPVSH